MDSALRRAGGADKYDVALCAEKWRKHRMRQEGWKERNRERYLAQKRVCACRPEYLALRRERYRARSTLERAGLSTITNTNVYDTKTTNESSDRSEHP